MVEETTPGVTGREDVIDTVGDVDVAGRTVVEDDGLGRGVALLSIVVDVLVGTGEIGFFVVTGFLVGVEGACVVTETGIQVVD